MTREEQAAEVQRQKPEDRRAAAVLVARGVTGAELDAVLNPTPVIAEAIPNATGKKARKAKQAEAMGAGLAKAYGA